MNRFPVVVVDDSRLDSCVAVGGDVGGVVVVVILNNQMKKQN
jgi:hypothetical protein